MLFTCLILTQLYSFVNAGWNIPTYVTFSIDKYSNSSCLVPTNNTDLQLYCRNSQIYNGVPSCCYEQLDKLSPFKNTKFNTCYNLTTSNETSHFQYKCSTEKINDLNLLQILGVIGSIASILFVIVMSSLFIKFCCSTQRKYNRV